MAYEQTTVLNIEVNYTKGIKAIVDYKNQIEELKQQQKDLAEQLKKGAINDEQYAEAMVETKAKMAALKDESRILENQLKNQVKAQQAQEGSLKQLRAALSDATATYDAMSKAERESAQGIELKEKINAITTELKGQEEETQRYYRNVGNYENSLAKLFDNLEKKLEEQREAYEKVAAAQGEGSEEAQKYKKAMEDTEAEMNAAKSATDGLNDSILGFVANGVGLDASLINMFKGFGNLAAGAKAAMTAVVALGAQLLKLMANPIVAFLGLLSATIMTVSKGIKSSEENMNRWNVIIAPVSRGLDALAKVAQNVAGVILSVVEAGGKLLGWMSQAAERLPMIGKYFKAVNEENARYIEIAREEAKIAKDTRDLQVQNAKDALTIATLKAKADDDWRNL